MADQLIAQDHWAAIWVRGSDENLSHQAFNYDGQHIGRGVHENGVHIGYITDHGLHIAYGGNEVILKDYEVLSANFGGSLTSIEQAQEQFKWSKDKVQAESNIPLKAGRERDGKELYIARAFHPAGSGYIYGKAGRHLIEGMSYAYKSREIRVIDYEVLVFRGNE